MGHVVMETHVSSKFARLWILRSRSTMVKAIGAAMAAEPQRRCNPPIHESKASSTSVFTTRLKTRLMSPRERAPSDTSTRWHNSRHSRRCLIKVGHFRLKGKITGVGGDDEMHMIIEPFGTNVCTVIPSTPFVS